MFNKRSIAVASAIVGLGGVTLAWLAQRSPSTGTGVPASPPSVAASEGAAAELYGSLSPSEYRSALAEPGNHRATTDLVTLYVDPGTNTAVRREILEALFGIKSLPSRLKALLDAAAADPRPAEDDALWEYAADRLGRLFADPAQLEKAADLMLLEKRPRARHLLVASMVRATQSSAAQSWTEQQRGALTSDFVDLYFEPDTEDCRAELRRGVGILDSDVALVLAETAHGVTRTELGALVRHDRAIESVLNAASTEATLPGEPSD